MKDIHILTPILLLALVPVLFLAGCEKWVQGTPTAVVPAGDGNTSTVEKLFTHDNVTVYRFVDGGRCVYFTSPATITTSSHKEGKHEVIDRTINTY